MFQIQCELSLEDFNWINDLCAQKNYDYKTLLKEFIENYKKAKVASHEKGITQKEELATKKTRKRATI